jgi:hypothetical protein
MHDSLLFEAGFLFFLVWSMTIVGLALAAFRHDLIPSKATTDKSRSGPPVTPARLRSEH